MSPLPTSRSPAARAQRPSRGIRGVVRQRFDEVFGPEWRNKLSMGPMFAFAVRIARDGDTLVVMRHHGCPFVGRKWPTEIE